MTDATTTKANSATGTAAPATLEPQPYTKGPSAAEEAEAVQGERNEYERERGKRDEDGGIFSPCNFRCPFARLTRHLFLLPFSLSLSTSSTKKKADLTDPSSFDEALQGCTALIHTASPVIMNPEKGRERELLIEPAVQGAENVLRAATRAKTVT